MQYLHFRSVFPTEHHPKTDTMKRLLLLLFLPFALGACDDGDTSRIETWTVAPETGVAGIGMGFGHVPAYIVKRDAGSDWEIGPVRIGGVTFERGYETRMRVRIEQIANPPADGPSVRCTMVQQIEHTRQNDITVNVTKSKQLTNMRASGSDDKAVITPPKVFTLEEALEYIKEDEYVEVTPHAMRLRKILLHEVDRKRASK